MEEDESTTQNDSNEDFLDAVEEFPFHDCAEAFTEPVESHCSPSMSAGDPNPSSRDEASLRGGLRRRRSHSLDKYSKERSKGRCSVSFEDELNSGKQRTRLHKKIRDSGIKSEESISSEITQISGENGEKNDGIDELAGREEESNSRETHGGGDSSLLVTMAGIVIKLISYQIHLFVSIFTFPVRSIYYLYMFVFDPFGLWTHCKQCLAQKFKTILTSVFQLVSRSAYEWLKEHQAVWKLGLKCGWGLMWSAYVCAVLLGILISAFVMGGMVIRKVIVEPVRIKQNLNFDYVEKSPVAFVPLAVDPGLNHEVYIEDKTEFAKGSELRAVPPSHRLKVGVSLTLPESDYNQNLGIFQVRVDFVSADGKILASSKRPCMLQFRSPPIRLALTLFKLAPILTGYTSETQTLSANFRGFRERDVPTAYLRVVVEQRAEFMPGAGIPEIYDASLTLESELPLLLHLMWFWKTTLFVWISMVIFAMEMFFALLFCKPLVLPKISLREGTSRNASPNDRSGRR